MNARIAKMWCEALVSGVYEKESVFLKKGPAYSALGVLCDLHRQEFNKTLTEETMNEWIEFTYDWQDRGPLTYYLDQYYHLPEEVWKDWAKMHSSVGQYHAIESVMGDCGSARNLSFQDIAEIIAHCWRDM